MTECSPLKRLTDVLTWKAQVDWSSSVEPLTTRGDYCYEGNGFHCHKKVRKPCKILKQNAPRTLLCHDMKGGYLDDRYVEGSSYNYQYTFYHWSVTDIFIYFSHYFVTIPPLAWINAAHKNGVKILGTVITENTDGSEILNELLNHEDTLDLFVEKLAEICQHCRFDGYLINIENKINVRQIPNLVKFLERLKVALKGNLVIWYDAVSLVTGTLDWQNELNMHNEKAFKICDGIFLNYNWSAETLEKSLSRAGTRQYDVYVGVDVFGRGCLGGGGFNTDVAMKPIRSAGLSVALFAPGWTHETQASDSRFFSVERKFWAKLWPYLYVHVPNYLPFGTTFNRGIGWKGSEASSAGEGLWYDLSAQGHQLSMPSCLSGDQFQCMDLHLDSEFKGGTSIVLHKTKQTDVHRLLLCDFQCSESKPLRFTVTVKCLDDYTPFMMYLAIESDLRVYSVILYVSREKEKVLVNEPDYSCNLDLSNRINSTKLVNVCDNDWITNEFTLGLDGRVVEISVLLENTILIGYLAVE